MNEEYQINWTTVHDNDNEGNDLDKLLSCIYYEFEEDLNRIYKNDKGIKNEN